VAKSVTKKLTHAVVGEDAGSKKIEQLQKRKKGENKVLQIDEVREREREGEREQKKRGRGCLFFSLLFRFVIVVVIVMIVMR